jgi:asparaginyl-tRNA synthetase
MIKTRFIENIIKDNTQSQEEISGWLIGKRETKNYFFLDLKDSTGIIQIVVNKKDFPQKNITSIKKIKLNSAISVKGEYVNSGNQPEIIASSYNIEKEATINLQPNPNDPYLDPFDTNFIKQLTKHPTFYISNRKLAAALKIKSRFRYNLSNWFWNNNYVQIEPPTFTNQTLYGDEGVFWVELNGQKVSLSRCATFHLEPSLISYEKVFCITDTHANEMSRSNRHLAEYTHLKAELTWVNLEELMNIAGKMFYETAKQTINDCQKEINILGLENIIENKIKKLNPYNHAVITYDAAVELILKTNKPFKYGKSLSTDDERLLTEAHNNSFLWIKYIPCSAEGFPFKRKKDAPHLTMVSDLIAPDGFAEILGTAEKITEYAELIERMKEKGKNTPDQLKRYKDYLDLRKLGLPEHGGIGMGIERAVRYLLNLNHVRYTRPFPVVHGTKINF